MKHHLRFHSELSERRINQKQKHKTDFILFLSSVNKVFYSVNEAIKHSGRGGASWLAC